MTCSTWHPLHACGLKWGRGTTFGQNLGVFEPDFFFFRRYMTWDGNVEIDTSHRGRDSGHGWVNIDMDTHKGQSLT